MRSVLLVSYTFPPQYDVSARRAAKLCKYLPAEGWRPVVLTRDWSTGISPEDQSAYVITSYPAALDELPGDVAIVRTPYHTRDNVLRRVHRRLGGAYPDSPGASAAHDDAPSGWAPLTLARRALSFFSPTFGDFPDAFRGWVDEAVRAGVEVAARAPIDAICSICPPASAHVVASEIARRTGVPWVAQFDDLFSFNLESQRRVAWRWYAGRAHRGWMRRATAAGAITPGMLEYVRRTYAVDGDVVMVGFDPAEQAPPVERRRQERMRLVYTGSVYLDDQQPELLFEAVERVLSARPEADGSIELVFAGTRRDAELRARALRFPAALRACTFVERLTPEATLALQRDADALVLLNYTAAVPPGGTLSFPAKSFEYLNARRPILALPRDPGGWGDEVLRSTGAGFAVGSAGEAAAVLEVWLRAWRIDGAVPYAADAAAIAKFAQPRQAAALAGLLNRVAGHLAR